MGQQAHLSIGEVLSLVQEDFPDITISKIRFLESQGLLDPERTPSGYRKFYPSDIERLEWILTQQRDHFLPLKVIRERLDEWDATGTRPTGTEQTPPPEELPGADQHADGPVDEHVDDIARSRQAASSLAAASAMEVTAPPDERSAADPEVPAAEVDDGEEPVADDPGAEHPAPHTETAAPGDLRVGPNDTALTAEELAAQGGVDVAVIHELESFSMIESRRVGPETYYDPEHLSIVRACRAFLDHGVEVRHLRMYKIAAEREAGVLEQLVMPLLKQRNPDARARAVATVRDLAEVGEELHAALLRHALQHTLP